MSVSSKKISMASKMYKQTGSRIDAPMKNYHNGKNTKPNRGQSFKQNGENSGPGNGQKHSQTNKKGSFAVNYHQSNSSAEMRGGYKQANT